MLTTTYTVVWYLPQSLSWDSLQYCPTKKYSDIHYLYTYILLVKGCFYTNCEVNAACPSLPQFIAALPPSLSPSLPPSLPPSLRPSPPSARRQPLRDERSSWRLSLVSSAGAGGREGRRVGPGQAPRPLPPPDYSLR